MSFLQDFSQIALIGVGATAVMDIWLLLLNRLGVPTLNFAFIGRWVGHLARGRFSHLAIAKASPIPAEVPLGWMTHYATGIAFAGLLVPPRLALLLDQLRLLRSLRERRQLRLDGLVLGLLLLFLGGAVS